MQATVSTQLPMLARNVTHFVRLLRNAGMPLAPSRAVDAIEALSHIDIGRRDDVKAALSALLVSHPDERTLFDAAFNVFWRDPDWEGKLRALLLPKVRGGIPPARSNRLADALRAQIAESSQTFEQHIGATPLTAVAMSSDCNPLHDLSAVADYASKASPRAAMTG